MQATVMRSPGAMAPSRPKTEEGTMAGKPAAAAPATVFRKSRRPLIGHPELELSLHDSVRPQTARFKCVLWAGRFRPFPNGSERCPARWTAKSWDKLIRQRENLPCCQ